jgi:Spy/CpxP family protein refolding chaperone
MVQRVARKLDLNEVQQAKLQVVKTKILELREEASRRREANKQEVVSLLSEQLLDRGRAEALVATHTREIDAKAPELIAALADFYDSLTPQQQAHLRTEIESRMSGHHWH